MSKKRWLVELNLFQVFIVLGLFTGFMFLSFGVGFYKGRSFGFDDMRSSQVRDAIPLEIPESEVQAAIRDAIDDRVYGTLGSGVDSESSEITTLAKIEEHSLEEQREAKRNKRKKNKEAEQKTASNKDETVTEKVQLAKVVAPSAPEKPKKAPLVKIEKKKDGLAEASNIAVLGQKKKEAQKKASREEQSKKSVRQIFEEREEAKQKAVEKKAVGSEKKAEPVKASSGPAAGWYAQVAAPEKRSVADELVAKLGNSGFEAQIETARVRGKQYFRVLVGPEPNRTLARRLLSQLGSESYVKGSPFIKRIE